MVDYSYNPSWEYGNRTYEYNISLSEMNYYILMIKPYIKYKSLIKPN